MSNYWFKPIKYSFGAYPITWQGWIVTFFLFTFFVVLFIEMPTLIKIVTSEDFGFLCLFVMASGFFKTTLIDKVDGGLKWRWGKE
jgi:hypothetical protein